MQRQQVRALHRRLWPAWALAARPLAAAAVAVSTQRAIVVCKDGAAAIAGMLLHGPAGQGAGNCQLPPAIQGRGAGAEAAGAAGAVTGQRQRSDGRPGLCQ